MIAPDTVTLGEITDNFDRLRRPVKTSDRKRGPHPYYGASGIIDSVEGFTHEGTYLLIAEDGENLRSRNTTIAFLAHGKFWANNHVHVVRANHRSDTRFLSMLLAVTDISGYLTGSTLPKLSRAAMDSIVLAIPSLGDQRAIADVIGSLDDKIAGNLEAAATAHDLTRTLFKLSAARTAGRRRLTEVANIIKGISYRGVDLQPSDTALVTLKSITRTGLYTDRGLKPYIGAYSTPQIVSPGDVIVAQTDLTQAAEVVGRAVRVGPSIDFTTLVASLDLAVARPKPGVPAEYLLGVLSEDRFRMHCQGLTAGTTVLHLSSNAFATYLAPDASSDVQQEFASRVRPMHNLIDSLTRENRALAALRDTLLPQLMSGKLRVKDAERQVEEVD